MAGKEQLITTFARGNNNPFKKNPTSSKRDGDGRIYSLFYTTDADGDYWKLNWNVPDTSTYEGATITIENGNSRMTLFEYPTNGITQINKLPQETKEQIVQDFNAQVALTPEEKEEQVEEYFEPMQPSSTVVREETSYGITITMTQELNSLDIISGDDRLFYSIKTTGFEAPEKNVDLIVQTQEEAETAFDYQLRRTQVFNDNTTNETFEGVNIERRSLERRDGTLKEGSKVEYNLSGTFDKQFLAGDEVSYSYSRYVQDGGDEQGMLNESQDFGIITGDASLDIPILQSYISYRLNPLEDDDYALKSGLLEVHTWGWYAGEGRNSFENPFESMTLENVYTIENTEGRILGLSDDDFALSNDNLESGVVKLKIKDGFRVRFRLMTQYRDYFIDNIPNLDTFAISHEQYNLADAQASNQETNYADTDKMTFDMLGGDTIEVDVDDNNSEVSRFQIIIGGDSIVGGAPIKLNDETFLAIIEVEKVASGTTSTSYGSSTFGTTTGEAFEPHWMYLDGEKEWAATYADHVRLDGLGYTHEIGRAHV